MRQPYFATHAVGVLYFLVLLIWYSAEIIMFFRQLQWRKGATRIAERGFWLFFAVSVIVAITLLYLAPYIAPAAEIGHVGAAFAIGMGILIAGVTLRLWSFWTLGQYFTFTVKVSPDQPVVTQARTVCCATLGTRVACWP